MVLSLLRGGISGGAGGVSTGDEFGSDQLSQKNDISFGSNFTLQTGGSQGASGTGIAGALVPVAMIGLAGFIALRLLR